MKYKPGDVVIVSTTQSGTVWWITDSEVAVILRNRDIWYGAEYDVRYPSNKKELKECPTDLDNKWKR